MRHLQYLSLIILTGLMVLGATLWAQNSGNARPDVFDRLDSNKDGVLTREEFNQARQAIAGRVQRRLQSMDSNGDSRISREEWTGPAEMFDRLDRNGDGSLSAEDRGRNQR